MAPLRTETEEEGKLYRSISEVSEMLRVKPHVLRYWETQFGMLRPRKNRAGNRMYRPEELQLLQRIKELLYERRFTIAGARRKLLEARGEARSDAAVADPQGELGFADADRRMVLAEVKAELKSILQKLARTPESRATAKK